MKKFTITLSICTLVFLSSLQLFAQSGNATKNVKETVALKPLYEMFTSSTCAPCAYANPIFDVMMDANPGTHSLIKYQMNWPGSGDPYYTAEGGVRRTYYSVTGVPNLFVNAQEESPSGVSQEIYDSYQTWTTSLEIEVLAAEIDLDNVITIEANLNALDSYEAGLIAHVVVVEKLTVENVASNGETEFHNVMLKMLPNASGTTLPELSNGSTETLNFTFDMDDTFMETANDLRVIIFVQNDSDKSIIQSEQVDVIHGLDDYSITFNMLDFNSNPVEGAHLVVEGYGGQTSGVDGIIVYEGVLPGTYAYSAEASGLISTDGEVELIDENLIVDVNFGNPGYYYFEDFTDAIPDDYTLHLSGSDFLYWFDGRVIFFRQSSSLNSLMLVSDQIDITPGEKIFFDLGEDSGFPMEMVFGTVTDPSNPETFVEIATIVPTVEWETHEFLLEDILPGQTEVYFAWKHNTTDMTFFSLDNIKINYLEGVETYKAYFSVYDGAYPIEGAEITINDEIQFTDDNGSTVFENLEDGTYNYTITANEFLEYESQFEINGSDVYVEVNLLLDGVNNSKSASLKIYPNPNNGLLFIQTEEDIQTIIIYNLFGQLIETLEINNKRDQIDMTAYENGMYLIRIETLKGIYTHKIILE